MMADLEADGWAAKIPLEGSRDLRALNAENWTRQKDGALAPTHIVRLKSSIPPDGPLPQLARPHPHTDPMPAIRARTHAPRRDPPASRCDAARSRCPFLIRAITHRAPRRDHTAWFFELLLMNADEAVVVRDAPRSALRIFCVPVGAITLRSAHKRIGML
ncbi:unnamed protein product, partial [Iphiclides podalirius]